MNGYQGYNDTPCPIKPFILKEILDIGDEFNLFSEEFCLFIKYFDINHVNPETELKDVSVMKTYYGII